MHAVGEDGVGLLKFDFLGLKNLTIMGNALKLIEKIYGEHLEIETIPLDDKNTYDMLTRGETAATFQLNGQGMTQFLKQLKPTNVNDINAMVALYRPGPMQFIPDFIERKNDPSKVKYLDERFKDILEPTFGILIYQDDIMMIAVRFAGYSWGEADKFRKAMGKKIPEIMKQQYEKFTKGCQEVGGLSKEKTEELWDSIETFAAYGFNKAHAASYGRVSYLTSYFKANYPVLYMTSVLSAESGDVDKVAEMVAECKRMKIEVLPPDINESFEDFTAIMNKGENDKEITEEAKKLAEGLKGSENAIRFGLTTIKNFGEAIANVIIEERKKGGKFESLEDFLKRVKDKNLNKRSMDALIKCGAMDKLGERGQMLANLEEILSYSKELSNESSDQNSLFGAESAADHLKLAAADPADKKDQLAWEKELLGLYVSGHPLEQFKEKMDKAAKIAEVKKDNRAGFSTVIAGHIDDVRIIRTKKGDEMAFIKISDLTDTLEIVAFPKIFEKNKADLEVGKCVAIKGKLNKRNEELSMLADAIKVL
jgi:DNA polymerase-3 subunit alpha